jgi:chromosome partitioning protein
VLTAVGVGWPDRRSTLLFPDVTGLGWPGKQPERVSSQQEQVSRGALLNGHEESPLPGSERVRQALSAAVSRGTPGAFESDQDSQVVVPEVPTNTADTPIGRAAAAAVGVRGSTEREAWPRPGRCRVMTIANQKGGVGKTTTAVNLAASLTLHGSRVLVIDLDPQGNASTALDVDHHVGRESVYNALVEERPLSEVITEVPGMPGLFCAPATIDLAGAEIELVPMVARESRLTRALEQLDTSNLDYVLIDCPPSLGLLTVNALVAAEEVLIPIQCEYYALEGLEQLLRTLELVRGHLNGRLRISTILLTMYDGRTRLATQVAEDVRSHFGDVVLNTIIPRSVRVSEAPSYGQTVITYDPGSSGAIAYSEAAREVACRSVPA